VKVFFFILSNEDEFILNNNGFLIFSQFNLYEMDELDNNYKGVFVGLTPNFGRFEIENARR